MSALVLSLGPLQGAAVQHFLELRSLSLSQLTFATDLAQIDAARQYEAALVAVPPNQSASASGLIKLLSPGAHIYVVESNAGPEKTSDIVTELLLNGLVGPTSVSTFSGAMVVATTPKWSVGFKDTIKLSKPAAAAPSNKWSFAASGAEDEDELVDEDELLLGQSAAPAPVPTNPDDCEVGAAGRKACKNCTCGRAEAEAAGQPVVLTQEMIDNPQSNCGSCGLGDAFRCNGCPYRGLPPFEMGKKIKLESDLLAADF